MSGSGWLTRGWVNDRLDDGETVVGCVSWTTDKLLVFIGVIIHTSCFHLFLGYILCFSEMTLCLCGLTVEKMVWGVFCVFYWLCLTSCLFTWLFEKQYLRRRKIKFKTLQELICFSQMLSLVLCLTLCFS